MKKKEWKARCRYMEAECLRLKAERYIFLQASDKKAQKLAALDARVDALKNLCKAEVRQYGKDTMFTVSSIAAVFGWDTDEWEVRENENPMDEA